MIVKYWFEAKLFRRVNYLVAVSVCHFDEQDIDYLSMIFLAIELSSVWLYIVLKVVTIILSLLAMV